MRSITQERGKWFYRDLPMVKEVRWYLSLIGDVYVIENWATFEDEAAWGQYNKTLYQLRADPQWESQRVTQEKFLEFLDTRITSDVPCNVGIKRS